MERKLHQNEEIEILLPTSLMEDIECDELDKNLQLIQFEEEKKSKIKSNYIINYFVF